ncbi:hypothetical protein O181_076163 [Austropuccinia psidii MF-1]|uniref:Integrase catalytic domain-containing protein n=1 Tax=Austropuccinia psidii MF-1 TaxID=1389203 RepID=A0A9Q3FAB4_9BASI|nr:hypothetical protein [Austropuccinia psidii MF-1]
MCKLPFDNQFEHVSKPLDCVHLDLVGPIHPASASGFRYFLTIVDQATSFKIIRLLKQKSEAYDQFIIVKKMMENIHDRTIKKLVSDCGGEFLNEKFKKLSEEQGFTHFFSPPETPQHNGFAERANRTILEKARCMLSTSNLPNCYWAEAVNTATLLSNFTPTPSRTNNCPFALWKRVSPRIKKIRIFGCRVIVSIPKNHREWKLGPTASEGILLGYENEGSCYRMLRVCDRKILISRHVKFDESTFPSLSTGKNKEKLSWGNSWSVPAMVDEIHPGGEGLVDEIQASEQNLPGDSSVVDEVHSPVEGCSAQRMVSLENQPRVSRIKIIGSRHPTIITGDVTHQNILPYSQRANALITVSDDSPRTFKKAVTSLNKEVWIKAIEKELSSMNSMGVWEIVELKPEYRLVGTTWVFCSKKNHLNEVIEHKARLCAQGFTQTPGIDFGKTYSPTGRLNSFRSLISFSASRNFQFHQVDVKSAFLNAPLTETVYLSIPQGLETDKRKYCLGLNKAIYGLKQAPLAWYDRLKGWLLSTGFKSCVLEPCVLLRSGCQPIWLYIHVDDIAIFGPEVENFKKEISREFQIKDIGSANLLLGIKILHSTEAVILDQSHYAESIIELYGMSNCKSFLEKPGILHWRSFLHVIKYLKGTQNTGLVYWRGRQNGLKAYSDADWGNCKETCRSISGYLALFNGNLVLWKTRKPPSVSISTAEAEYKAVCDLVSELLWLRQWGRECGLLTTSEPVPIHEDNQSCINSILGNSNLNNKRMKHVDIQLHFVKEAVESSSIWLVYTPTQAMLADFLTKSVNGVTLKASLNSLGVLVLDVRGDVENCNSNDDDIVNNQEDQQSTTSSHQISSQLQNRLPTVLRESHDDQSITQLPNQ